MQMQISAWGVSEMRTKADKREGVTNYQIFADDLHG